jgi:chromosome transmission fidelity protein 8
LGEASVERKFIGDLHFSRTSSGAPILIIGHHILYGKEVALDKPIVAVEKVLASDEEVGGASATDYVVKAIVKKKLLFKTRPKPIIANVPKKI